MEDKNKYIYGKIKKIKSDLLKIGPMRPGNINEQFKNPKEKTGSYYQLNYTHNMKTKTEYIRKSMLVPLREETSEYRKFKALIEQWIELSVEASKHRIFLEKEAHKN